MKKLLTLLAIAFTFQCVGQGLKTLPSSECQAYYIIHVHESNLDKIRSEISMNNDGSLVWEKQDVKCGCNDTIILTEHTTININCDYTGGAIVVYGNGYQLTIKKGNNKILFRQGNVDLYPIGETNLSHYTINDETFITIEEKRRVSDAEFTVDFYEWWLKKKGYHK